MPPAIPLATYRLQLSKTFGFDEAAALVPYLKALSISHLYASPFLKARSGSTHGYDIIDHSQLNPEFGGNDAFARLSAALDDAEMGLILDFVPNHMGVGHADNMWWLDVLEWGPRSPYADSFDIDWDGLSNRRGPGLLLPIHGKPYSEALEHGEIELQYDADEGSFSAWYFDHRLPIRPSRYAEILRAVVHAATAETEAAGHALIDIAANHSRPDSPDRDEAPALKSALAALPGAAEVIERGLAAYRPQQNDPARVAMLHRLLERQYYRLAHWRVAVSEINYRRFFDVSDLAGIRVENWRTFRDVHHLVAALIADGRLHGLRLDHIDGLYDPVQYTRRLQRLARRSRKEPVRQPFYILVEKILADGEAVPALPGVAGTTGYEVLNDIMRVLQDDSGTSRLDQSWRQVKAAPADFEQVVRQAKQHIVNSIMASEFMVLVRLLARIAAGHWPSRDYTLDRLRAALELFVIHFPVYRTYITESISADDRTIIMAAIATARDEWVGPDASIFDFVADALTLDLIAPGRAGYGSSRVRRFAAKMQQFTGPVMAKALEDTSFYRYHRLLARNEVGGEPSLPALAPDDFHQRMAARVKTQPHGLTTTATHDTKRGEDARMRILALSELAADWSEAVARWMTANSRADGPSAAHQYMIYQALIGAWPLNGTDDDFVSRMQAYVVKAAREGKQQTSWMNPREDYEAALTRFVTDILDPAQSSGFISNFAAFARRAALIGALNSLSQLTLKATIPGVPDIYQGTEFWDLSLVDPDNRRPVDFAAREQATIALVAEPPSARVASWPDGHIKLALTLRLLALRRQYPDIFTDGRYEPLAVSGPDSDHAIAFARIHRREAIIVVAGRHFAQISDGGRHWPDFSTWNAVLDLRGYRGVRTWLGQNQIPSATPSIGSLLAARPVAILQAQLR